MSYISFSCFLAFWRLKTYPSYAYKGVGHQHLNMLQNDCQQRCLIDTFALTVQQGEMRARIEKGTYCLTLAFLVASRCAFGSHSQQQEQRNKMQHLRMYFKIPFASVTSASICNGIDVINQY